MKGSTWSRMISRLLPRVRRPKLVNSRRRTLLCEQLEDRQLLSWTIMVYMAADNDLEPYALQDLQEMAAADNSAVNIVAQLDRAKHYSKDDGNWTTAKRFLLTSGVRQELQDLGEVDMGSPDTLVDFVSWAARNYQADDYALILWNHGGGWQYGVCYDESSRGWLTMSELQAALAQAPRLAVVAMDACLMGEFEVAYQLRNYCDYFVASADYVPYDGFNYQDVLSPDHLKANTKGSEWSQYLVTAYQEYYESWDSRQTLMAANMSKVNNLSAAFSALAGALRGNVEEERSNIQTAWDASRHYDNNNAIDLYDFCDELASTTDSETLKQAAESVKAALISDDSGFIAQYWRDANSWRTTDGQRCLSVFFPENPSALKSYSSLDFVQSGPGQLWCEFLTAYFKKGGGRGAKDGGAGRDLEGRGVPESSLASQADMALAAVCLSAESACGANTTWSAAWTVDPTSPCPITPVALITPDGTSTRAAADAVLDRSVADRWELDGELVADVAVRSSAREDMGATSHCRYAALQALMTEEDQYGFTGTDLGRKQVGWPLKAPYRRLNSDSAKPSQGTSTPGRLEPARA